jgi:predicted acyl esterase
MPKDKALRWTHDNDALPQEELVEHELVKKVYDGQEFEIPYLKVKTPNDQFGAFGGHGFYAPFNQRTYECLPGILCDQDVPNKLRDGRTMYSDIYRPIDGRNLPVILCWTNYGKRPQEIPQDWEVLGVPPGTRSPFVAFETADPDYWCRHGYAVAITDAPGAGASEGDCDMWGEEYAQNCYDYIEWVAQQWWCNGRVAMVGNSSLAMVQWLVGAMNPPHLACLAPWEGTADIYREFICPGGVVNYGQYDAICFGLGRQGSRQEDLVGAFYKYPLYNAYWESKRPKVEKITVPVYCTGSWSHLMHLRGACNSFRALPGKKWFRLHREMEWQDFHTPKWMQDLMQFLDRYAKGIHNGWELTPTIRLDVQDAYDYEYQLERPEQEWPLARTQYTKLCLDATNGSLSNQPSAVESQVSYDAQTGVSYFEIEFQEDVELTGYFKAHLWVEADGSNDMDIMVTCQKYSKEGEFIPTLWCGQNHMGAWGALRASHRELDRERTTDFQPWHTHTSEQLLKPGEIVPLEIELWPHSRIWHKGERLRMNLSGHLMGMGGWWIPEKRNTRNAGRHIIHTGGKYDSYLQIPVVPPRYQSGDFVVR